MAEELLQRLLTATDPAEKAALVARSVLEAEEPALAELVPVLAFLRWFDEPVVAALLPERERPRSAELYARLIELPFVERVSYGYALHDLTRQGLLAEATAAGRKVVAQAADVYAQKGDFESLLESLYCAVLGEESETAHTLLEKTLYASANRSDWSGLLALFGALLEAETLVGHEVLTPTFLHWFAQGLARHELGDLPGAVADYDRAIALNPEDATAYNNRGNARSDQGDLPGALADYDSAIALFPDGNDKLTVYLNKAITLRQLERYDEAAEVYRQALTIEPDSRAASIGLAELNRRWDDDPELQTTVEKADPLLDRKKNIGGFRGILRVSADSPVASVAGAIAGQLRDTGVSTVQAIGISATYTMIKAVIIAQRYVDNEGMKLTAIPSYTTTAINGEQRTALRLTITTSGDQRGKVPLTVG